MKYNETLTQWAGQSNTITEEESQILDGIIREEINAFYALTQGAPMVETINQ